MRNCLLTGFLWLFLVLSFIDFSQTDSSNSMSRTRLYPMLLRRLEELKSQQIQDSKNMENRIRNDFDTYKRNNDETPLVLPDGFPPELAVGPGNPPRSKLQLSAKRSEGETPNFEMTCKEHEWFVFLDDMPACVNPIWEGGYDPTFCSKMKSGWVYCGCDENQIPGMIEGLDTCIKKEQVVNGRCDTNPCPQSFNCKERLQEQRFDCVRANLQVPTWY